MEKDAMTDAGIMMVDTAHHFRVTLLTFGFALVALGPQLF
jgi:hypothetical protein